MLFNQLSSNLIKAGLISRLQFSLGFSLINKHLITQKLIKFPKRHIETGELDESHFQESQKAKAKWVCFQDYCKTNDYETESIEAIVQSYINSINKPVQNTSTSIIALRAKIAGGDAAKLQERADKETDLAKAKIQEQTNKLIVDLADSDNSANAWYGEIETVDEDDIILDSWVIETYPKILKSQVAYWTRFNNWDDGELILIDADQAILQQATA